MQVSIKKFRKLFRKFCNLNLLYLLHTQVFGLTANNNNRFQRTSVVWEQLMHITDRWKSDLNRRITGSALALHCCKAHAKINGKIENLTPCKIATHEDFNLKLGTRDYIANITHHTTLGSNRPSGGFPPNRGNITLLWLFCYTVFSLDPAPRRTVALIVTLNGSNDVFPPKEVPFGGLDDGWRHMGKIFPKSSPKRGVNRQFQAKTPKSLHRNISGTINPTK